MGFSKTRPILCRPWHQDFSGPTIAQKSVVLVQDPSITQRLCNGSTSVHVLDFELSAEDLGNHTLSTLL